jgi:alpha-D-ribose 1-methylphosphonate 5-triphosphate synthase subunit PhnH
MSLDIPGLADPVADAQRIFRAVLDSMAHPGRVSLIGDKVRPPAPLAGATAALLLTLADADTPLWCDPAFAPALDWVRFHCGSPIVSDPATASFAVLGDLGDPGRFSVGSDEEPERSATLILQVAGFGTGRRRHLSGPGLREPETLAIAGLPDDFGTIWAANHALYPRGFDLLLVAGDALVALPRSVRVGEAG